ncbi:MAG: glycosyltransferase [Terriglobales bacterium]
MPLTTIALPDYRAHTCRRTTTTAAGRWRLEPGEHLLAGTPAQVHAAMATPGRRTFVPVHYAAAADWELIGLEPRGFGPLPEDGNYQEDRVDLRLRIAAMMATQELQNDNDGRGEPWQRMRSALRTEWQRPGSGIAALAELARDSGLHVLWQALALRNVVAVLARQNQLAAALALVEQARQTHPGYRELNYLEARLRLARAEPEGAMAALQRTTQPRQPGAGPRLSHSPAAATVYVGSGGEDGYRAHYLLAAMAARCGNQAVALRHYLTGVVAKPPYEPSVIGLLRERAPRSWLAGLDGPLLHLGRTEERYQPAVFAWWLLHQRWEMAERALRLWPLTDERRIAMMAQLSAVQPRRAAARRAGERAGVVLQGPFLMIASSARINRYLGGALRADPALDVALEPTLVGEEPERAFPLPAAWAAGLRSLPRRLDVTIRHSWPPDFRLPEAGKLALILPWEFGAIPRNWVAPLQRADQVWVPSQFVRDVLQRGGVEGGHVAVIANGVNLTFFCPDGPAARPAQARSTCFLFVGGAIARKGMDVLLAAWRRAFTRGDDVTLVIKAMGTQSFYRHLSLAAQIAAAANDAAVAPIVYREDHCSEEDLAKLYRGCDVVVLPYRGEGFGMPLAEALACGKPVIATQAGPAPEFCPVESAWWVAAEAREVPPKLQSPQVMTAPMTWFEPAIDSLVAALRAAASASTLERARRGRCGMAHIHAHYGWERIIAQYRASLGAML